MLEMALERCCHVCDAPDEPNSIRCKTCITSHKLLMKNIKKLKEAHPIRDLAMELITKTRNQTKIPPNVIQKMSVEDIIKEQRKNKNYLIKQDSVNIKEIVETLPEAKPEKLGRTHTKKSIEKINLDERLGEEIKDEDIKNKRDEKYKILDELNEYLN
jgi:hypothetical protein